MPTVEVIITISVDPDSGTEDQGIAADAEELVNECFYARGQSVDDALVQAEDALRRAMKKCELRARL